MEFRFKKESLEEMVPHVQALAEHVAGLGVRPGVGLEIQLLVSGRKYPEPGVKDPVTQLLGEQAAMWGLGVAYFSYGSWSLADQRYTGPGYVRRGGEQPYGGWTRLDGAVLLMPEGAPVLKVLRHLSAEKPVWIVS